MSVPQSMGVTADMSAVSGERMLIGPMARLAYSSAIATAPTTPERAPQARSVPVHAPPRSGSVANMTASPATAAIAETRTALSRLAARPPRKSAAPYTSAPVSERTAVSIASEPIGDPYRCSSERTGLLI
jgi:hypothetical protein